MKAVPVVYKNLLLLLLAESEEESKEYLNRLSVFNENTKGTVLAINELTSWCQRQRIPYKTRYIWRKEYPLKANLYNLYIYGKWKLRDCLSGKRGEN